MKVRIKDKDDFEKYEGKLAGKILLMDKDLLSKDQLEIVQIIDDGGKRLHELIVDLLDLSKLESGNLGLDLDTADLVELVRNVYRPVPVSKKQELERLLNK